MAIKLNVNGEDVSVDVPPEMPLLWVLRDTLSLTGTKYGCGAGLCGACAVMLDGKVVNSCMTIVSEAAGKSIVSIEGLSPDGKHPVQEAWRKFNVPQCGFCQPGQIMQASALLAESPHPTDQQILNAMQGNICRCGTYQRIVGAVRAVAWGS